MSEDKDIFFELYRLADTVIYVEEIDTYKQECFDLSVSHMNEFFKQFNKRIKECKNENEMILTKESTLNFLIFSLKKLIADYDCPDENIEFIANHIKDQILKVKRCNHE